MVTYAKETLIVSPVASTLFNNMYESKDDMKKMQFLLDSIPEVIAVAQIDRECLPLLFSLTTMWFYSLNMMRTKLPGK